ncbi:MAG: hypothetical protein UW69_C0041G0003 [Microgenomates group bacterium GW2011_GWA2_44_7]|nr:MAG: hypothetical protein UW69_C0041G0003 [Microgenomates group bacterium GW2011_GWA2_44_7]KKT77527.1 MAG: hypothetical protein UW73_C0018G0019 [Microgenomates group bacterium GW2011_GWB1_44_8]KKW02828.1 MAG: hypothetical protein UY36_C0001G0020 [Parcubacteria group bacterium GW2011_GWA1_49_11]
MVSDSLKSLLAYASDWERLTVYPTKKVNPKKPSLTFDKDSGQIYLPYPFVAPNTKKSNKNAHLERLFYWDSLLIIKALTSSGNKKLINLARAQVDNFDYLFKLFSFIPNEADITFLSRSQPPFLTTMILDVFKETKDKKWLLQKIKLAKEEYRCVWTRTAQEAIGCAVRFANHRVDGTVLCHFGDRDVANDGYAAEAESGMDCTRQYGSRAGRFLSVMLNSCLYKYEVDFAEVARMFKNKKEENYWLAAAKTRKAQMNKYLWDDKRGYYFDYDLDLKRKNTDYFGLTGFMPLWTGAASEEQAALVNNYLPSFKTPFGLTTATKNSAPPKKVSAQIAALLDKANLPPIVLPRINDLFKPKQWDYPNIWAPLEYFALAGLVKNGNAEQASKVMKDILSTLAKYYKKYKTLPEKINGLTGDTGGSFHYKDQAGFGWTNALVVILERYLKIRALA